MTDQVLSCSRRESTRFQYQNDNQHWKLVFHPRFFLSLISSVWFFTGPYLGECLSHKMIYPVIYKSNNAPKRIIEKMIFGKPKRYTLRRCCFHHEVINTAYRCYGVGHTSELQQTMYLILSAYRLILIFIFNYLG